MLLRQRLSVHVHLSSREITKLVISDLIPEPRSELQLAQGPKRFPIPLYHFLPHRTTATQCSSHGGSGGVILAR